MRVPTEQEEKELDLFIKDVLAVIAKHGKGHQPERVSGLLLTCASTAFSVLAANLGAVEAFRGFGVLMETLAKDVPGVRFGWLADDGTITSDDGQPANDPGTVH